MIKIQSLEQLWNRQLCDGSGRTVGRIVAASCGSSDRYVAEWAIVRCGVSRRRRAVLLRQAQLRTDGRVYVPYPRQLIGTAPIATSADLADPRRLASFDAHYCNTA